MKPSKRCAPEAKPKLRTWPGVLALAVLLMGAGCGEDSSESSSPDDATTTDTSKTGKGGKETMLSAPEAKESIEDAQRRIDRAIASEDCDRINSLELPSRQDAYDTASRCEGLITQLSGAKPGDAEAFKGGGIIEYSRDDVPINVLTVLDRDGRFYLLLADLFLAERSVGTSFADGFDRMAHAAVGALAEKDCDAFLDAAYPRFGIAGVSRPKSDVCDYVNENPIANLTAMDIAVKPKPLGGNSSYAFYGVSGPDVHFTIVMARLSDTEQPESAPKLPKDAPEYGVLDVLPTH